MIIMYLNFCMHLCQKHFRVVKLVGKPKLKKSIFEKVPHETNECISVVYNHKVLCHISRRKGSQYILSQKMGTSIWENTMID